MAWHESYDTALTQPDYWNGVDIYDEQQFIAAAPELPEYLSGREYRLAKRQLRAGLGTIAVGVTREVTYGMGNTFDTELDAGTIVVADQEVLIRWIKGRSSVRPPNDCKPAPAIRQPFADYWFDNQPRPDGEAELGVDQVDFPQHAMTYLRTLSWGVLVERRNRKVIQPFPFAKTGRLDDGRIEVPANRRADALNGVVLPLPLQVGETNITRRITSRQSTYDSMHRVASLHVVHPVRLPRGGRSIRKALHSFKPQLSVPLQPGWVH